MDKVSVAFWGAYFGAVALMLAASIAAYVRSLQYVALMAALSALISGFFVVAYLGWLPMEGAVAQRVQAHVAVIATVTLGLMFLSLLGLLRRRHDAQRAVAVMFTAGAMVITVGWVLDPLEALIFGSSMALGVGTANLGLSIRSARRGDRLAPVAIVGVSVMLVATGGLSWIAVQGGPVPWPLHAVSAVAGVVYLATMASAMWVRYSYLLELSEVMAHGPSYDPVTRMRSHVETGQLVGDMFFGRDMVGTPLGVIAVTIANLRALENLHGRAAFNHALFICAGRLRRHVPAGVEMGRLGEDGFLLLLRDAGDAEQLTQIARVVRERLSRTVVLSTSRDRAQLASSRTHWTAEVGVGMLAAGAHLRPSQAVAAARAMSLTAWSYPSRVAWLSPAGQVSELPVAQPAG
jgi:GGDEF domain-containing protein